MAALVLTEQSFLPPRSRAARSIPMNKFVFAAIAAVALAGCGTQMGDRLASGAGIGAATGAVAGPIGVGTGALVGAGVAAFTPPDKVNLGEPVWNK
jgi:osmotically inducible lipoprotein OsmB